ncbi:OmpA family protein [Chitinophagaceae bacterium MMS25-I14]
MKIIMAFVLSAFVACLPFISLAQQDRFAVYFPVAVYRLPADAQDKLDMLFYHEKIQGAKTIAIYGYADEPGGGEFNEWLSLQRARAVKEYLLRSGIKPQQIVACEGKGHVAGRGSNQSDRRVDILRDVPGMVEPASLKIEDLKENETLELKSVLFEDGTHNMLATSMPELEALRDVLKSHPSMQVRLEGHICCQVEPGDGVDGATGKLDLSVNRAKAVYDYLVQEGIAASRLSYKGLGNSLPARTPEITPEDQQANRRVDVRVMHK